VSHVGTFPELEAELTGWVPGDPRSPNRLDALVWCLTELMLGEKKQVRVYFPGMEKAS
jgi:phage terminase large subunit-like protein